MNRVNIPIRSLLVGIHRLHTYNCIGVLPNDSVRYYICRCMSHAVLDLVWQVARSIAGQCWTKPWPAVTDWTLMPECQCRTAAADYRKKWRFRTTFFRQSGIYNHITRITQSEAVYKSAGCIFSTTCSLNVHWVSLSPPPTPAAWTCIHFHRQQYGCAECVPPFTISSVNMQHVFQSFACIRSVRYQKEQKCRRRHKSGTRKGPSPVQECSGTDWENRRQNADAGGLGLDADAQIDLPVFL